LVDDSDYTTFGVKLAGPMPSKEGDLYLQKLKGVLEISSITLEIEETVDD
jgi:hypothetical protein